MDCSLPGSYIHGIFQQGYWSGLPFPSPGVLPSPRIKPRSPALQAYSLLSEPPGNTPVDLNSTQVKYEPSFQLLHSRHLSNALKNAIAAGKTLIWPLMKGSHLKLASVPRETL